MIKIPLTKGLFALIDDEDFAKVSQYKWTASRESRNTKWYAIRMEQDPDRPGKRKKIRMHRFIMGLPVGRYDTRVVDHINDDGLDNTRGNLQIVTQEENMAKVPGWRRKVEEPSL